MDQKKKLLSEKAIIVLSGGQDSVTCLFWAIKKFGVNNIEAVGFDYNQRHKIELEFAEQICKKQGIAFSVIKTPLINELTINSLTRSDMDVDHKFAKTVSVPPNSFVDGRNLLFLSYAAIIAKNRNANYLITGVGETDFSGYPDCRDIFIKSLNVTLNLAMDYQFVIETPLMWKNKAETWVLADELGVLDVILNETMTCYNGVVGGCGECPACQLRQKGYDEFMKMKKQTRG